MVAREAVASKSPSMPQCWSSLSSRSPLAHEGSRTATPMGQGGGEPSTTSFTSGSQDTPSPKGVVVATFSIYFYFSIFVKIIIIIFKFLIYIYFD
jgi:hypothetical protein